VKKKRKNLHHPFFNLNTLYMRQTLEVTKTEEAYVTLRSPFAGHISHNPPT